MSDLDKSKLKQKHRDELATLEKDIKKKKVRCCWASARTTRCLWRLARQPRILAAAPFPASLRAPSRLTNSFCATGGCFACLHRLCCATERCASCATIQQRCSALLVRVSVFFRQSAAHVDAFACGVCVCLCSQQQSHHRNPASCCVFGVLFLFHPARFMVESVASWTTAALVARFLSCAVDSRRVPPLTACLRLLQGAYKKAAQEKYDEAVERHAAELAALTGDDDDAPAGKKSGDDGAAGPKKAVKWPVDQLRVCCVAQADLLVRCRCAHGAAAVATT